MLVLSELNAHVESCVSRTWVCVIVVLSVVNENDASLGAICTLRSRDVGSAPKANEASLGDRLCV